MSRTPELTAGTTRPVSGRRLLPYLTLGLLVSLAVFVHVLPNDPEFMLWLHRRNAREREARWRAATLQSMARDPAVGAPVTASSSPLGQLLRGAEGKRATLLLLIGPCAPCVIEDVRRWEEMTKRQPDLGCVLVSRDSQANIDGFRKKEKVTLPILPDEDGGFSQALNGIWVPRAYLLDNQGRLLWVQTNDAMTAAAVAAEVNAVLKEDRHAEL
jgi:hypothetical protein